MSGDLRRFGAEGRGGATAAPRRPATAPVPLFRPRPCEIAGAVGLCFSAACCCSWPPLPSPTTLQPHCPQSSGGLLQRTVLPEIVCAGPALSFLGSGAVELRRGMVQCRIAWRSSWKAMRTRAVKWWRIRGGRWSERCSRELNAARNSVSAVRACLLASCMVAVAFRRVFFVPAQTGWGLSWFLSQRPIVMAALSKKGRNPLGVPAAGPGAHLSWSGNHDSPLALTTLLYKRIGCGSIFVASTVTKHGPLLSARLSEHPCVAGPEDLPDDVRKVHALPRARGSSPCNDHHRALCPRNDQPQRIPRLASTPGEHTRARGKPSVDGGSRAFPSCTPCNDQPLRISRLASVQPGRARACTGGGAA